MDIITNTTDHPHLTHVNTAWREDYDAIEFELTASERDHLLYDASGSCLSYHSSRYDG